MNLVESKRFRSQCDVREKSLGNSIVRYPTIKWSLEDSMKKYRSIDLLDKACVSQWGPTLCMTFVHSL